MYKKISDYGIIGDLHSVALIGLDGSIDWLCMPHIDSPSIFGALLDDKKGGRFKISPADEWDSVVEYMPDTNILVTKFRTKTGVMRLTDFMPVLATGEEELEKKEHELYRLVEVTKGEVNVSLVFEPKFDYARADTLLKESGGGVVATGDGESIALSSTRRINITGGKAASSWRLKKGDRVWLNLRYGESIPVAPSEEEAEKSYDETKEFWRGWLKKSETGRSVELGHYQKMINRSALVLKLLYYNKTDKRLQFYISPLEKRIHFALVCGSSSCPPIGVYTAENLDEELDIAAEAFINGGAITINIDRLIKRISLSRIFKWYGNDFGKDLPERLRFIARYLYNEDDKKFVMQNAAGIKVYYQDYDWRLNKS